MSRRPLILLAGLGVVAASLLLLVGGIGNGALKNRVQDLFGYGGKHSDSPEQGRDLFHTGADISGVKEGLTYARFDARRDASASQSIYRFGCLETCVRHEAGFRWAVRHEVQRVSDCAGLSWSAVEGCAAYALLRSEPGEGAYPNLP